MNTKSLTEAKRIMSVVHRGLSPKKPHVGNTADEIWAGGYAWCAGYAEVFKDRMQSMGYRVKRATLRIPGDTHEVVRVWINGDELVFDPTYNLFFPISLRTLIRSPILVSHRGPKYACYDFYFAVKARRRQERRATIVLALFTIVILGVTMLWPPGDTTRQAQILRDETARRHAADSVRVFGWE